ncbi:ATP-binding protein [Roseibium sp.]|uniref:ATP-binding protein n=1 Tax=Roseibium sp. TaxID=1936156 RepID=UPI003B51D8E5
MITDSQTRTKIGDAKASPTKEFFVKMLTRDIELEDAILDLLDNCLDGVVRSISSATITDLPYSGFEAKLTISPEHFSIEDNCGGIPIDIAKKYAFTMGRPPNAGNTIPGTIGMYGIGMKRAIFKLGTDGFVESFNDESFWVEFSSKWMASEDWDDLPMYELPSEQLAQGHTKISVLELAEEVKSRFGDANWVDDFKRKVAQHYALIIAKGFSVRIGTPEEFKEDVKPIEAESFSLLSSNNGDDESSKISPHYYTGEIDGVKIEIFAGLYRELLSQSELDTEEETRGSTDSAGWTVACNDRVVIWKDKTKLTGWGEASVPNYHGQFIPITGIVLFSANDTRKLPLTTTKRGIDAASNVFLSAKDHMRTATKAMTTFTNKWKKFPEDREKLYRSAQHLSLPELRRSAIDLASKPTRKDPSISFYAPTLPSPRQENTSTRVSFVADKNDVKLVSKHFFDTDSATAAEVGKRAFDEAIASAKDGDA